MSGVDFSGSKMQNTRFTNCILTDVTFYNCKFHDVFLKDVNLQNVVFYDLGFVKTRLEGIDLTHVLWEHQMIVNAMLGPQSFGAASLMAIPLPLPNVEPLSGARSTTRTRAQAYAHFGMSSNYAVATGKTAPHQRIALTKRKATRLLDLPRELLNNIMTYLYSPNPIYIVDSPATRTARIGTSQTVYRGSMVPSTHVPGKHQCYTTYMSVNTLADLASIQRGGPVQSRLPLEHAFLFASKGCHDLAIPHLYSRRFLFACSAEGSIAFFHDHQKSGHLLKEVTFYYFVRHNATHSATNIVAWRYLINVLVHQRHDLDKVSLVVSKAFWSHVEWSRGAEQVFKQQDLGCSFPSDALADRTRNFLEQIARLPLRRKTDKNELAKVARKFVLHISGQNEGGDKESFVRELQNIMETAMRWRPDITEARGKCCSHWRLQKCCYWGWNFKTV